MGRKPAGLRPRFPKVEILMENKKHLVRALDRSGFALSHWLGVTGV